MSLGCRRLRHTRFLAFDKLSPLALEQVRDYCTDYDKGRKGVASEFKRARIELVVDHLNDAKLHERRR
jgi:hypothetical protein